MIIVSVYMIVNIVCVTVDGTGGGSVDMPDDYGSRPPPRGIYNVYYLFMLLLAPTL